MKTFLILIGMASMAYGAVTYTKDGNGVITKSETLTAVESQRVADELAGKIAIINERIAKLQSEITQLEAIKTKLESEVTAIESVK